MSKSLFLTFYLKIIDFLADDDIAQARVLAHCAFSPSFLIYFGKLSVNYFKSMKEITKDRNTFKEIR